MDTTDAEFWAEWDRRLHAFAERVQEELPTLRADVAECGADIEAMQAERTAGSVRNAHYVVRMQPGAFLAPVAEPVEAAVGPGWSVLRAPVADGLVRGRSLGERVRAGLVRVVPEISFPAGAVA